MRTTGKVWAYGSGLIGAFTLGISTETENGTTATLFAGILFGAWTLGCGMFELGRKNPPK